MGSTLKDYMIQHFVMHFTLQSTTQYSAEVISVWSWFKKKNEIESANQI